MDDSWPRVNRGWEIVPAIRLSHLTESQRMAFLIADNRLTENFGLFALRRD
jgi:hypothetical protein